MKNKVSIAILTFNGEEYLKKLLDAIESQKTGKEIETIVIDSGSTDKTLDILADYPKIRLHKIPNSEFGHGKTRNLAADLSSGEFILYLTQDAVPSHEHWLEAMIEPFEIADSISCVVGKQIPHSGAPATIKREVTSVFKSLGPDDGITLSRKNPMSEELSQVNTFMSNTNSAVRMSILKKIPFRDVEYAEDQGLGIDMLDAGYFKAYSPLGSVDHSHDYSAAEYFRRKYDEYVGLQRTTGYRAQAGIKELIIGSTKATILDWIFIFRDKQYSLGQKFSNFFRAPLYNVGLRVAIRKASSHKLSSAKGQKYSLEAQAKKAK